MNVMTKTEQAADIARATTAGEVVPAASAWRPPVRTEVDSYVALLERAALDPAFDLNRLQRLIDMKDKALADAARREFNQAMRDVQAELPQVVRDAENTHTHSRYSTLEKIGEAIDPIVTAHGFFQSFSTDACPTPGHYRIVCVTGHVGGHQQTDFLDIPIDNAGSAGKVNKTGPHALASTITYGRRILKLMVWDIKSNKAMPDDDGNAAGRATTPGNEFADDASGMITPKQLEGLEELINFYQAEPSGLLKFFKISTLADMTAANFKKAVAMLNQKYGKKGARQ